MLRVLRALLAVALTLAVAACSRDAQPPVVLDGSPRVPDDEGVATALSHDEITLDDERTYRVSPALRSFSALTLEIEPMLLREGQYVQIGVRQGEMVWMGGVSAVTRDMSPPSAFFTGLLDRVDDGRLVFANGTVFRLKRDVQVPDDAGHVAVQIDVEAHQVVRVTRQAR